MRPFQTACLILATIGFIAGLICGVLFPPWVIASLTMFIIVISAWGVYMTYWRYDNKYEFNKWSWLCASMLVGLPLGYSMGLLRVSLISTMY